MTTIENINYTTPANIKFARLLTSRIMSWVVILFMLLDGILKLVRPAPVVDGTIQLGYASHHILLLGVLALIPTILYAIPKTAILGAVLLTGYLGGAVATHIRMDNPLFTHILVPVYIGILMWGGLWLRDKVLQQIFPVRLA
jgi:DoxX-like family